MNPQTEVELKFIVPQASCAGLVREMARAKSSLHRSTLVVLYLDTADRRLARAGLSWRLRREGRRWVQTLKATGSSVLEQFEHEVVRPKPTAEPALHAGTVAGERLMALLDEARKKDIEPLVRFRTEVRRTTRRVSTRGAVVELAYDEGRLVAGEASRPIREIEFELVSGSTASMLRLVERWRHRFGLIYEPRSKAERGDGLAEGTPQPPVRKAQGPDYAKSATAAQAFRVVLAECLDHLCRNCIGLVDGDPQQRVDHVHQARVAIRRLRSALRSFRGWAPQPPPELVERLRHLFAALGDARDSDVLASGVMADLAKAGAPPTGPSPSADAPDPAALVRGTETQLTLLAGIAWTATLDVDPAAPAQTALHEPAAEPPATAPMALHTSGADDTAPAATAVTVTETKQFQRQALRRLRRWHARIVADWKAYDSLDLPALHALRKRVKRQRYAIEFFSPVLRSKQVQRYLKPLSVAQESLGALNDAVVASGRYEALETQDPGVWFARGWLTARMAELREEAKSALAGLAKAEVPGK